MATGRKLYIDADGVKRGYYVYLHKDRASGKVFYVGKGHGRRAWDAENRNDLWKAKVETLSGGWDVVIAEDDLSEIEAFRREAELVDELGGCAGDDGRLANLIPGGENPSSIEISFELGNPEWGRAYYEKREFKAMTREEQETFATRAEERLGSVQSQLSELEDEAEERENEKLQDSASDGESIIASFLDVTSDFLNRRSSWKDVGLALEDLVDDLEGELESPGEHHRRVLSLFKRAHPIALDLLRQIDSGNRAEAESHADRVAKGA